MHRASRLRAFVVVCLAAGLIACSVTSAGTDTASASVLSLERPFLVENQAAMDRMMVGMAVTPSGDVDKDFAAMMIPHHQGAIEMAQAELLHGHNEHLRRIAQEIIVEQQQEIVAMRLALGQTLPASAPAPDQAVPIANMQRARP